MDFSTVLLAVAVVCFVIAAFGKWGAAVAVGLGCFAGAFLVQQLTIVFK
jgi:hypothetical protein